MPFEQARTLGARKLHRHGIGRVFMRRPADDLAGIAFQQRLDIVEMAERIGGRVDGDAMHHGEVDAAMVEEADQLVDLRQQQTAGREDRRHAGLRDGLEQRPVEVEVFGFWRDGPPPRRARE